MTEEERQAVLSVDRSSTALNIKSVLSKNTLYYVKSGRLVKSSALSSPHIPQRAVEENRRLIRQLSRSLKEMGIEHCLYHPNKKPSVMLYRTHPSYISILERVFITSRPHDGLSYIHVTVFNSSKFQKLDDQLELSFIANTPGQIIDKLIKYELIDKNSGKPSQVNNNQPFLVSTKRFDSFMKIEGGPNE
jgi:hypothetical protein